MFLSGNNPKISLITVVYNDIKNIETTMLSVLNQSYKPIEYIVIDGGSTDGTVELIKKYENQIDFWMSEPDKGIYDAMNKGIKLASGKWIAFINSGDTYMNNGVIYELFVNNNFTNDLAVIYCDIIFKYKRVNLKGHPLPLDLFPFCFPIFHPSSFVKLDIMKTYLFDISYKIAADYNFFYTLYLKKYKFNYIPICTTIFEAENGISSSNYFQSFKEALKIRCFFNKKSKIYYCIVLTLIKIKSSIKMLIPDVILYKMTINRMIRSKRFFYH